MEIPYWCMYDGKGNNTNNIKTREVMMDIFSCKRVDEQKYKEIVMDLFNGQYQDVLIRRGRRNIGRLETSETRNERYRYWQETINQNNH